MDNYSSHRVKTKLGETTTRLEQQLAEEQATRLRAEELAHLTQMKSNDEIRKLREHLEKVEGELHREVRIGRCVIL
uniref:Uncharacterized protein n=1 Tax=Quercus lobata TaxID=97700 RepID=A0A7N2LV73_QUELO